MEKKEKKAERQKFKVGDLGVLQIRRGTNDVYIYICSQGVFVDWRFDFSRIREVG